MKRKVVASPTDTVPRALGDGCSSYSLFIEEDTGSERLSMQLKVTQPGSGSVGFGPWNSGSQRTCCFSLFYTVPPK